MTVSYHDIGRISTIVFRDVLLKRSPWTAREEIQKLEEFIKYREAECNAELREIGKIREHLTTLKQMFYKVVDTDDLDKQ